MYKILAIAKLNQHVFYLVMVISFLTVSLICLVLIRGAIRIIKKYIVKIVMRTSPRYKDILAINGKYNFHQIKNLHKLIKNHNSKAQFDRFDYSIFLEDEIEKRMHFYDLILDQAEENAFWLRQYHEELESASSFVDKNTIKGKGLPYFIYRKVEQEIVSDIILHPTCKPKVLCKSSYTSPKGRNSYRDSRTFSYSELIDEYNIVCDKIEKRQSKEFQRKLMTASLRYNILKRDAFKCVLCGRSKLDGVKLHVDHILPVSKGGKTVPSNLRTLCADCNLGKSDKYDEYGDN